MSSRCMLFNCSLDISCLKGTSWWSKLNFCSVPNLLLPPGFSALVKGTDIYPVPRNLRIRTYCSSSLPLESGGFQLLSTRNNPYVDITAVFYPSSYLFNLTKSRDITLPTKVRLVKAMVSPVVIYGCESWTVKKAELQRIDAFELWCWRRLLRVLWTARRSNQSLLKEISPD